MLLLFLPMLNVSVRAQTAGQELQKVRNAYLAAKQLSFDVEVYTYATKNDKTPELVSKGTAKKSDDLYYSNFNNYELMVIGDKALLINRNEKSMAYYEYKLDTKKMPATAQPDLEQLLADSDSVVIRPEKDGLKHFTSYSKSGYVKQTEIYADAQTYLIKHILYYYVASTEDFKMEADRVEIFYKNIQTSNVDPHFFTFASYFKKTGANAVPVGKYQGYKLKQYNSKS